MAKKNVKVCVVADQIPLEYYSGECFKRFIREKSRCMLMFNYGVFATFIPELIMVLGFVLSIVVPGFFRSTHVTTTSKVSTIYTYTDQKRELTDTYVVSSVEVQQVDGIIEKPSLTLKLPQKISLLISCSPVFSLTDKFGYALFSRPPPVYK